MSEKIMSVVPELPWQRECPHCGRWIGKKYNKCPKCANELSPEETGKVTPCQRAQPTPDTHLQ